ncbi:Alpha/Beta hydrolase protein [Cokeromyces recurvatus]|uniref:Alpha/Beta hydrolase protein n=1 Tax=Cokeromyces recurvatus TaxID=90255 RepID=UPI00221FBB8C|nr:Alpha/Beta hydrolase protein [Cokeromyces recurvatus]KAI7906189.1 Alpha/Beta hydrolase protein [Cokeromyces recurvatus]
MKHLSTLREKGYVQVGHQRQRKPIKLYYEMHGNGPERVLLVMGLSTPCGAWDHQVIYFYICIYYTVIVFDNRGMGFSDAPIGLYSTSQMAMDALELLDYFNWKERVHLVGISMGGMISLEMADADVTRFQSLTLTSTTARRNLPTWTAISTLSKITFLYRDPRDQLKAAIDLVYPKEWLDKKPLVQTEFETNRDLATHGFIGHILRSRRQTLHGNIGQTAACLRHYVSDKRLNYIKSTGLSIMIVTGTFDNLVRPEYSYHMKKILEDARFELFEGSGHAIPEEQPERYNHLLIDHFKLSSNKNISKL